MTRTRSHGDDDELDDLSARVIRRDLRDLHAKVDIISDTLVERVVPCTMTTAEEVRVLRWQMAEVLAKPYPEPRPSRIPWWFLLVVLASPAISLVGAYLVTRS